MAARPAFCRLGAARLLPAAALALILAGAGCKAVDPGTSALQDAQPAAALEGGSPHLCAAIRGNGNLIAAHWAALARILETYGVLDATAGGSSGSMTEFLYESMYANPNLRQCAAGPCSAEEVGARAGLLMKSLLGYLSYLGTTDEAVALQGVLPIFTKLQSGGITAQTLEDPRLPENLLTILRSKDLIDVINPELLQWLEAAPLSEKVYVAKEIWAAISSFGNLKPFTDNIIFFRPGVLSFPGIAKKLGFIGSFYAGYFPRDGAGKAALPSDEQAYTASMRLFLDDCAVPGRGKSFADLSALPAGSSTCGQLFHNMLLAYRTKLKENEAAWPSRADDPIGKYLPMLISTSVLDGEAAYSRFETALAAYRHGTQPVPFTMDFNLIKFGYWGRTGDLDKVGANPRGYADLKTSKFMPLGQDKWLYILSYSPAEPSLARLQEMTPSRVSAGGWSDLHPVLVLKNLGCDKVIYVTRRGEESGFAESVAHMLGVNDDQMKSLYSLDAESSQLSSISQADGVWCTNWNAFDTPQLAEMSADSYNAPFEARASAPVPLVPYGNASTTNLNIRGCSVGAPPLPL